MKISPSPLGVIGAAQAERMLIDAMPKVTSLVPQALQQREPAAFVVRDLDGSPEVSISTLVDIVSTLEGFDGGDRLRAFIHTIEHHSPGMIPIVCWHGQSFCAGEVDPYDDTNTVTVTRGSDHGT